MSSVLSDPPRLLLPVLKTRGMADVEARLVGNVGMVGVDELAAPVYRVEEQLCSTASVSAASAAELSTAQASVLGRVLREA